VTASMPDHCIPILYGRLEASQPHLPASRKTKSQASVTDLQNKFEKLKTRQPYRWFDLMTDRNPLESSRMPKDSKDKKG